MDLNDRVAIVTGAARGIGRAIAQRLADYGASVTIADLRSEDVEVTAGEIGHGVDAAVADVTDEGSVSDLARSVVERDGRVDILVNNAGIIGAAGWERRERHNEQDWDEIYAVNVKGIVKATEAVAEYMKPRRFGKIINIASHAGRKGSAGNMPYTVSKSGVITLTQSYAMELAPFNINVNAICPGTLWTSMWDRIATRNINLDADLEGLTPREMFERAVAERIPLGREQTPEDIGNLAVFLASDLALNITGQAINVNGGVVMN